MLINGRLEGLNDFAHFFPSSDSSYELEHGEPALIRRSSRTEPHLLASSSGGSVRTTKGL